MRILHLLKHGRNGNGNVHVAVDLACAQADLGHDVTFAAGGSSFTALMESHGVRVVDLVEPTSARQALGTARQVLRLFRSSGFDIVNAHMMSAAVIAFPIAKLLRTPMITTMHNSFDGHSALMRLGTVVIAVSDAERRLLLTRGFSPDRVVTVVNGADASPRQTITQEDRELARPCVMTLSGLHPRKAVDDVMRAFAEVAPSHPAWHLNIVGAGPSESDLLDLRRELGLGHRIHFLGYSDAPRALLEQADVFATATLADPCPLTVMEARAAGCAIVATAVGGIPETLEMGRAGLLAPPRTPVSMATHLHGLMSDPTVLTQWRANAREGSGYFTVERMAMDHLSVYRSVVEKEPLFRPSGVPIG